MVNGLPRYTSYPTAPQFSEKIGEKEYKKWLYKINKDNSISLYFHIPFCTKLCWFCGCTTKIINKNTPLIKYLDLLKKEIKNVSIFVKDVPVKHIHFGGGSPSLVPASNFISFMKFINNNFNVSSNAEIAIEIDPRTVDIHKINAYKKMNINRVSIGVQDFNTEVQKAINRIQPFKQVSKLVEILHKKNIKDINIDLIYGLPFQTKKSINKTIKQTISLSPGTISYFGYAHVPWMKKNQKMIKDKQLPSKDLRILMFSSANKILEKAGYIPIGLDHFSHPKNKLFKAFNNKTLKRNFQGYSTDKSDTILGFGLSSISSFKEGYIQNVIDNSKYNEMIKEKKYPIARGFQLTVEDIERRNIIMSLMCFFEAKVNKFKFKEEINKLKPYIISNDLKYDGTILYLNPKSRNLLRFITSVFDTYLSSKSGRFSQPM
ncbi:MAG: oxygen-independent coproporphyrinogen III oxidase [Pelagibacterales bacterium]|jgi:oxygen-independent coproporphyrinogen-3 oxidase|nr:oxygen-independent coproporphyrinogen III oxidase [Pelagibacterales bacterium]MBT7077436.1 oxygen-independent coproporphyrinogen III oxidase [Pelagibacterales bacterium]